MRNAEHQQGASSDFVAESAAKECYFLSLSVTACSISRQPRRPEKCFRTTQSEGYWITWSLSWKKERFLGRIRARGKSMENAWKGLPRLSRVTRTWASLREWHAEVGDAILKGCIEIEDALQGRPVPVSWQTALGVLVHDSFIQQLWLSAEITLWAQAK